MKEKNLNSFDAIVNEHIEGHEQELNTIERDTQANLGFAKAPFSFIENFFNSFFGSIISMFGGKR